MHRKNYCVRRYVSVRLSIDTHTTFSGNIESLRDLPLTSLALSLCKKLEGMMDSNLSSCAASKQHPNKTRNFLCPYYHFHTPSAPCVGVMSPHVFVLLLEGKANFEGCGTVTMPSADAMAQASPDIINRFQAIKEVNFSGMTNLAGELCGLRATP